MQVLPLIGGAYSTRSVIANAQRCVNLYPEKNRDDSPVKVTHYQRPGLVPLATPGSPGLGRGLYQASNGDGYMIVAGTVYYIDPTWTLHSLGTIDSNFPSICSMVDNGTTLVIVDGVPFAGNATGNIAFSGNPSNGDTITLNSVVWTFVTGSTSGTNIHIGGTCGITIATLLTQVQASSNPLLTGAYYQATSTGSTAVFYVTFMTSGAIGTAYTLAASAATPSGANLALGSVPPGNGWTVALGSLSSSAVTAMSDAAWTGADKVDYIDTFVIWNQPGTVKFGSTLSNQILPLDSTYVASKVNWPDPMQSLCVNNDRILLIGTLKGELWYDAGNVNFPFAAIPGIHIEHGLVAKYSLCSADINFYWLSKDLQGQGIVVRQRGNEPAKRISNYAIEYAIRLMYAAGVSIADAVGYTYQMDGHLFYVLSFPSGNQTWVWDESVEDPELGWSQRCWTDAAGVLNRDRGVLGCWLYGKNVCLDWQNGTLYEQKLDTQVDTVGAQDYPVTYLRTFPHLMLGTDPRSGQPILSNGQMVKHDRFMLNVEYGNAPAGIVPEFTLRWSDDRGASWKQPIQLYAGKQGEYGTRTDARVLGQAMDRIYEVSWTFPGKVALNGAWVEGTVLTQ